MERHGDSAPEFPNIAIDIRELRRENIDIGLLFFSIQDPAFNSVLVSAGAAGGGFAHGPSGGGVGEGPAARSGIGNISHPT
ncbi:MAG TPA: hypothetical protein VGN17_03340 [Bryobacteraceae bacterium]